MPSEAHYSRRMLEALKGAGIPCFKTADKFTSGIPDIYVAGGNWIETKKVPLGLQKGNSNVTRHFATNQMQFAKRFMSGGDMVFWFIIFYDQDNGNAQHYLIAPVPFFRRFHFWTHRRASEWGFPTYKSINFTECFDPTQPQNRNKEGINEYLRLADQI